MPVIYTVRNYFVDKSSQQNENLAILMNERVKFALNAGNRCCVVCYSLTIVEPVLLSSLIVYVLQDYSYFASDAH